MGPFTSLTWQRPAPGRRAGWLEIQEALTATVAVERQQWRGVPATADEAQGAMASSGKGQREAEDLHAGHKSPSRGRRAAAWRPDKVSGSPTGFPGRPAEAFRAGSDPALGCRCGARGPVAPPALHAGDGRRVRASPHDNRESNAMKSTRRNDPYKFANYMRKVFDILTDLDRWERRKMSVQRSCTNIGKCTDLRCRRRKRCQKLEWVTSNTEALRTRRAALQATWPTVKPTSNPSPDTRKGAPECALERVACACCAMD